MTNDMKETTTDEENKRRKLLEQAQTVSQAFNLGTSAAIQDVINELDAQAAKRVKAGFNEVTFTFGVLNCFLILFVFGSCPQHFWLLYLIETIYFFPTRWFQMTRAVPNQAFYYLDYCWIMNFCGVVALGIMMFCRELLPKAFIQVIFFAAYGAACGPLLASNIALSFVALIFHDVGSMTSLFIHIYPPMLLYILRWNSEEVTEAWPNTFDLDYDIVFFPSTDGSFVQSVFGATTTLYFIWFVLYTIWQLSVGLSLPKNNGTYDTVFHSTLRGGLCIQIGTLFWKRSVELSKDQMKTNDFHVKDFILYMSFHAIGAIGSLFVLAYPCSLSKYVHAAFLFICLIICTWRGAQRYTYYSTDMYSNLIRKQFSLELIGEATSGDVNGKKGCSKKCM